MVNWVPRVDRSHQVLCGFQPTGTAMQTAAVPVTIPTPIIAQSRPSKPVALPATVTLNPPAPAPEATYAQTPAYVAPVVQAAPAPQPLKLVVALTPVPVGVPKGYVNAWQDDRLNPQRGPRSTLGQAQMGLVWDDHTPRRLKAEPVRSLIVSPEVPVGATVELAAAQPAARATSFAAVTPPPAPVQMAAAPLARMSTSNAPAPRAVAVTGQYVQVGSFGQPGNAAGAAASLRALGLPVTTGSQQVGGRLLQVVLAGPFTAPEALAAALDNARHAGFPDAFTR